MTADPQQEVVELVPQRDPAEHPVTLHDPSVRATHPAGVQRLRRVRLVSQPGHPGREPGRRVHLIGQPQPEPVLVDAGTPLVTRLEPGGVQADGGRDQFGHAATIAVRVALAREHVKAVQRMLGHASAAMTLDVYADLLEDDLDQVADRLDRAAARAAADSVRTEGAGPALDAVRPIRRHRG